MRIGFDAKWFHVGPPSGRLVVRRLVEGLITCNETDELFIFMDKEHIDKPFPRHSERVHIIPVWAGNNLFSNVFVLPWEIRRLRLDVAVFQNFPPFVKGCGRIAFIYDVLFVSFPEFYSFKERLYFSPLRMLARSAEKVCTISENEKRRLLQYGFCSSDGVVDVIPLGVEPRFRPVETYRDAELTQVRERYNLPPSYVLFVGRLNVRKNIRNLLLAMLQLARQQIFLVVVGDDDWKTSDYRALSKTLHLSDRVLFLGSVPDVDLPIIYALARVFCFPSLAEGFGLPALEAMACGVPVVVSDRTALPEVCGEAGNYVNPEKPEAIADTVSRLWEDKRHWQQKREAGLERARTFTWERATDILLASIHTLSNVTRAT
jgi:glycosyltransferase involved in cell wall biosynthesis